MKNDKQYRYAEHVIKILYDVFPESDNIDWWFEGSTFDEAKSVFIQLEDEGWIEKSQHKYKMTQRASVIYKKHQSYIAHESFLENEERKKERKESFDFHTAKWKYYTFWPVFLLGLFGGFYSLHDFISSKINKEKDISKEKKIELVSPKPMVTQFSKEDQRSLDSSLYSNSDTTKYNQNEIVSESSE